jgi:hypothetical protein
MPSTSADELAGAIHRQRSAIDDSGIILTHRSRFVLASRAFDGSYGAITACNHDATFAPFAYLVSRIRLIPTFVRIVVATMLL